MRQVSPVLVKEDDTQQEQRMRSLPSTGRKRHGIERRMEDFLILLIITAVIKQPMTPEQIPVINPIFSYYIVSLPPAQR